MAEVVAGLGVFGLVIAVGWLLVRTGAVPAGADTVLTRVCFFAATPALLVTTVSQADLRAAVSTAAVTTVASILGAILAAWFLQRLLLRRSVAEALVGALASGYVNAANLGIPVTVLVLGDATAIAPVLLLQLLVITPITFMVLDTVTRRGNPSRLGTLTVSLRNPLLWAVAAGVVVNLAGWDLQDLAQGYLAQLLDLLGRVAVPLMMLSLGMSLAGAPRPLRRQEERAQEPESAPQATGGPGSRGTVEARFPAGSQAAAELGGTGRVPLSGAGSETGSETGPGPRTGPGDAPADRRASGSRASLWWAVAWKLLVVPATAVLLGLFLGLRGDELLVPVVTVSLPTAQNVFMYASRYGVAKDLARDAVLLTTVGFVPVVLLAAAVL